jgi:glycosyltransferase involved in cell wall biosynthesis
MVISVNTPKRVFSESAEVTYIGAVIPSKGLHLLAKIWGKVLKKNKNAVLNVIGSGSLYDPNSQLGPLKLASEAYENKIVKLLRRNDPELRSIRIYGVLAEDAKNEIISRSRVGVPNPSARTETFGLSSTDFQLNGIPVVVKQKNGLLDTVELDKTGLGFKFTFQLSKRINKLLIDEKLNDELGKNGPLFVKSNFDPSILIPKWDKIFMEAQSETESKYIRPTNYFSNNFKVIRILNRFLRMNIKLRFLPSTLYYESKIHGMITMLRKNKN